MPSMPCGGHNGDKWYLCLAVLRLTLPRLWKIVVNNIFMKNRLTTKKTQQGSNHVSNSYGVFYVQGLIVYFIFCVMMTISTHWRRDKMAAIFQTTYSNAFSWLKMYEFLSLVVYFIFCVMMIISTHWRRDKMAAIFQTTYSNAFSWI